MSENSPIITFKNADILNGEATVIYGLDMEIYPSDFVYIVGKVGTGKTSIIRTMIAEDRLLRFMRIQADLHQKQRDSILKYKDGGCIPGFPTAHGQKRRR